MALAYQLDGAHHEVGERRSIGGEARVEHPAWREGVEAARGGLEGADVAPVVDVGRRRVVLGTKSTSGVGGLAGGGAASSVEGRAVGGEGKGRRAGAVEQWRRAAVVVELLEADGHRRACLVAGGGEGAVGGRLDEVVAARGDRPRRVEAVLGGGGGPAGGGGAAGEERVVYGDGAGQGVEVAPLRGASAARADAAERLVFVERVVGEGELGGDEERAAESVGAVAQPWWSPP